MLLRDVDAHLGLTQALAQCFTDHRQRVFIGHGVQEMLAQRIYGLGLGYEDVNDTISCGWIRCWRRLATSATRWEKIA